MNIEENINEDLQCENCIICLDNNETINNNIIEYNHCGKYNVHEKCNDKWMTKHKSCFICRSSFLTENQYNVNNNDNDDNFVDINTMPNSGMCDWRILMCTLTTVGTVTLTIICITVVVVLI